MKAEFFTRSLIETQKLAGIFASELKGGETFCLCGPIGSGKTAFTQGIAKELGIPEVPASASFALMRSYTGRLKLFHFDLFRLDSSDMRNLGIEECLADEKAVVVAEWADPAVEYLPIDRVHISFELAGGDGRKIKALGCGLSSSVLIKKAENLWKKEKK